MYSEIILLSSSQPYLQDLFSREEEWKTMAATGHMSPTFCVANWNIANGEILEERGSQNAFCIRKSQIYNFNFTDVVLTIVQEI